MIDTVPVKKAGHREPLPATKLTLPSSHPGSVQARYLVAEYLRDWGLRDPDVIAVESRRIVEQAEVVTQQKYGTISLRHLCATAILLTMNEVEEAIAGMAASSSRSLTHEGKNNRSVVPHVARLLQEFPDAIRHRDRPPARLLQVLEQSVAPIIPHPQHREMLAQPSTRLCSLFRGCFWMELCGRFQGWLLRRTRMS
ncbi:MAG TPA: hypothetical protein VNQ76_09540 [Planctomicrobium sp.]|nr:hypothetical protein [Planctomicrobium sp.]